MPSKIKMTITCKTTFWYKAIYWLLKKKVKKPILFMKNAPIIKMYMDGKKLTSILLKDVLAK